MAKSVKKQTKTLEDVIAGAVKTSLDNYMLDDIVADVLSSAAIHTLVRNQVKLVLPITKGL